MPSTETTNYKLGHHLVAFLDVLGQRDKFRGLRLPTNPAEHAHVNEVLRQTAGFVVNLRRAFARQFEVFESALTNMREYTKVPIRLNFVGFSDSFVTSVPLRNDNGDLVPIVTVFSALSAAAVVMLTAMASKHPLRGGIDVGLATEIAPGEIYGSGLERAYLLECKTAKYPRIVIGGELLSYLRAARARFEHGTDGMAKSITAIVQSAQEWVSTDTDGCPILDYLGATMVRNSQPDHAKNMVQPAYEFVLTEQRRLLAEGNPELIERYVSFRRYVESRLPLWGITLTRT
jgi:hypothetical protein